MSRIGDIGKRLIFWPEIRSFLIARQHSEISRLCGKILSEPDKYRNTIDLRPKKDFAADRIIWQYWGQGYEPEQLPEVVRICLDSVDKYAGDAIVVRLSDANIDDYLNLPEWLKRKESQFNKAAYSDLIRCMLLAAYGGCWLDATVYLSDEIPAKYWDADLFIYSRDDSEENKSYWENVYAAYFGWNKRFKVRILNSIIFCKRGNTSISEIANILADIWKNADRYPHYFFMQILTDVMMGKELFGDYQTANDCLPHYLQQLINDPKFNLATFEEIMNMTSIHKLTYKFSNVADTLKQLTQTSH